MMSPEGGAKDNLHSSPLPGISTLILIKSRLNSALLARSQLQKETHHPLLHETSGELKLAEKL